MIEPREMRRGLPVRRGVVMSRRVSAARLFDLDHPCTEVGEVARRQWCRDRLFERDDGDPVQRFTHDCEPERSSSRGHTGSRFSRSEATPSRTSGPPNP